MTAKRKARSNKKCVYNVLNEKNMLSRATYNTHTHNPRNIYDIPTDNLHWYTSVTCCEWWRISCHLAWEISREPESNIPYNHLTCIWIRHLRWERSTNKTARRKDEAKRLKEEMKTRAKKNREEICWIYIYKNEYVFGDGGSVIKIRNTNKLNLAWQEKSSESTHIIECPQHCRIVRRSESKAQPAKKDATVKSNIAMI